MKKFQRVYGIGLVATLLSSMLVGCQQKAPITNTPVDQEIIDEEPVSETDNELTGEIRIASMFGEKALDKQVFNRLIAEFKNEHPRVNVKVESAIDEKTLKSNVLIDFAAENEPDIIYFFVDDLSEALIAEDKLVSIQEIQSLYPDYASNIHPKVLEATQSLNGRQYAVPIYGYYQGLFLNTDLFEAHHIELPTDWATLEEAITSFAETNITPIAASLSYEPNYWIDHLILAEGGVIEHSNQDLISVKATWINALTHFKTLSELGAFSSELAAAQNERAEAQFINKQAAMLLSGSWCIDKLGDTDTVKIIPIPSIDHEKNEGKQMILDFSSGFYITKKAWNDPTKREAVVKLVEALTCTEAISQMVTATQGAAPATQIESFDHFSELAQSGLNMLETATSVDKSNYTWLNESAQEFLKEGIVNLINGEEEVEQIVEELITIQKTSH